MTLKGQREIPAIEIEIGDLLWLADSWAKVTGWYLGAKGKVRIEVNDTWIERSKTQHVWVQRAPLLCQTCGQPPEDHADSDAGPMTVCPRA